MLETIHMLKMIKHTLAGVLLGQGWTSRLINLAGIPLNPISVSESGPEPQLSGPSGRDIGFFGGGPPLLSEAIGLTVALVMGI